LLVGGTASLAKLSTTLQSAFPTPTIVLPVTYNPSELIARGAAIQSSLISSYDPPTISEAIHPVVTIVPHLLRPLGLKLQTSHLDVILEGDTALPCRGKREYLSQEGGDVVLRVYEGRRETEVVTTPPTPPPEGEEEEEEEEVVKRRVVVPEREVAWCRVRGVRRGGRVEVQVQVDGEGRVTIVGREVGRKEGGITKGVVEPATEQN
jgi:molecular chaperone DnaK (HSP70)